MAGPIYLDYNATTPVDPRVREAMLPYLAEHFGNASSGHSYGHQAKDGLERARRQVADLIGAQSSEIVFTAGGSESDNLAIKGAVLANFKRRPHVVTSAVEHPAVRNTLAYLKRRLGVEYTAVPVDEYGCVDPEDVRAAIRPETVLITLMHAQNEVGTIQPLREVGAIARAAEVLFHSDAAQSVGKIQVDVAALGVDLLTVAGHKLYGPKGIGALYVRRGVEIDPLVHGSAQEGGMRAGTENVASIVGLGAAAELAQRALPEEGPRLRALRDRLFELLAERIPRVQLNGHPVYRLPNTLNVSLPGTEGEAVLSYTPGVAASTGSACHSGQSDPSAVLLAMGLPAERALSALRLSLGRWTTNEDVDRAAELLTEGYSMAAPMRAMG